MSKHAAPDDDVVTEPPAPQRKRGLKQDHLPHIVMLLLFITWVAFQVPAFNGGSTPQTINVAFAGTLGIYFPFLIKQVGDNK